MSSLSVSLFGQWTLLWDITPGPAVGWMNASGVAVSQDPTSSGDAVHVEMQCLVVGSTEFVLSVHL